jgi:hypothetical protein
MDALNCSAIKKDGHPCRFRAKVNGRCGHHKTSSSFKLHMASSFMAPPLSCPPYSPLSPSSSNNSQKDSLNSNQAVLKETHSIQAPVDCKVEYRTIIAGDKIKDLQHFLPVPLHMFSRLSLSTQLAAINVAEQKKQARCPIYILSSPLHIPQDSKNCSLCSLRNTCNTCSVPSFEDSDLNMDDYILNDLTKLMHSCSLDN